MEFKYFKLIKTIEEEGSIANSSKKLFLTQSAISHQLKELEERLGFKVFILNSLRTFTNRNYNCDFLSTHLVTPLKSLLFSF